MGRAAQDPPATLADRGSCDGAIFWAIDAAGLIGDTVPAVDISAKRVSLCERLPPKVRGIVSDVAEIAALPDDSVDAVVSSQVIEQLPDERVLITEVARILRPGGWFYVASVMRVDAVQSRQLRFPFTDFTLRSAAVAHLLRWERRRRSTSASRGGLSACALGAGSRFRVNRWVKAVGRKLPAPA